MKHLREKFPVIRVLNVFSDGEGSQFKQMIFVLELALLGTRSPPKAYMELLHHISWKRCRGWTREEQSREQWRHVRSGQVHRTTAEEYAKIAEQRNPKIHLQYC